MRVKKYIFVVFFLLAMLGGLVACGGYAEDSPVQLSAPQNLKIIGTQLSWDDVPEASRYAVEVEGEEERVSWNHYELPTYHETKQVTVRVKAVGDGLDFTDSEWAEILYRYEKPTPGLRYTFLEDGTYAVDRGSCAAVGRVYIPDFYNGRAVTRLIDETRDDFDLNRTFYGCTELTSVRLPALLEYIGESSFRGCTALEEVEFPDHLVEIGKSAFASCSNLKNIALPSSLEVIGASAFGRTGLEEVVLSSSLEIIGASAFAQTNLKEIDIPEGVKAIGNNAFYNCEQLAAIEVPESVVALGGTAFKGTAWLNNQPDGFVCINNILYGYKGTMPAGTVLNRFPEGVTSFAISAFAYCAGLTEVVIPEGWKQFTGLTQELLDAGFGVSSDGVFEFCRDLKKVTLPSSFETIEHDSFTGCGALAEITFSSSLKTIEARAFMSCRMLTEITLPHSLQTIGLLAFSCGIERINYMGTIEEWKAMERSGEAEQNEKPGATIGTKWDSNTGDYTIHCTDGVLAKDGTVLSRN